MSFSLIDPVMIKELSGLSRRGPTYIARGIYVLLVGVILYKFSFATGGSQILPSLSEYADLSRQLFHQFIWLQLALVTLAAAIAAAETIPREFERGMIGVLSLTPLTYPQLVVGKWKAAMLQAGSLLLCGVPFAAICVYLGGVGVPELASSTFLTAASASVASAFALRRAAGGGTVMGAVFATAGVFALWAITVAIVGAVFGQFVASCLHPFFAASASGGERSFEWMAATVLSFAWTRRLLGAAGTRLEARVAEEGRSVAPGSLVEGHDRFTRTLFLQGYREFGPRTVWDRLPLLWKDLTTRAVMRGLSYWRMPVVFAIALIILPIGIIAAQGVDLGFLFGTGFMVALLAVVNGASLFASEKSGRRWDLLLTTPIPSWEILGTKLLAGLVTPESTAILGMSAFLTLGGTWKRGPGACVLFLWTGGLFFLFCYLLAAAVSLRARTVRAATVATLAALATIFVGASWLWPEVAPFVHPPGLIQIVLEGHRMGWGSPRDAVILYTVAYASGILALALWMLYRFDRLVGRTG